VGGREESEGMSATGVYLDSLRECPKNDVRRYPSTQLLDCTEVERYSDRSLYIQ